MRSSGRPDNGEARPEAGRLRSAERASLLAIALPLLVALAAAGCGEEGEVAEPREQNAATDVATSSAPTTSRVPTTTTSPSPTSPSTTDETTTTLGSEVDGVDPLDLAAYCAELTSGGYDVSAELAWGRVSALVDGPALEAPAPAIDGESTFTVWDFGDLLVTTWSWRDPMLLAVHAPDGSLLHTQSDFWVAGWRTAPDGRIVANVASEVPDAPSGIYLAEVTPEGVRLTGDNVMPDIDGERSLALDAWGEVLAVRFDDDTYAVFGEDLTYLGPVEDTNIMPVLDVAVGIESGERLVLFPADSNVPIPLAGHSADLGGRTPADLQTRSSEDGLVIAINEFEGVGNATEFDVYSTADGQHLGDCVLG